MIRSVDPAGLLAEGVTALGLELPPGAESRLLAYGELVLRWNRVHNLTAACDAPTFVRRHLLDCLAALPWVPDHGRLLDIGSGAGLPGLVFALARPLLACELVEPRIKRVAFLNTARTELGIDNVQVVSQRVEDLTGAGRFDVATARAVTALTPLWELAAPHLRPAGRLLALVGHPDPAQIAVLEASGVAVEAHRLQVPGLGEVRHLVAVRAIA